MTGKELADRYRKSKSEILALHKAVCAGVDERLAECAVGDMGGVGGVGKATAPVHTGKFCGDIMPQRDELEHTMAVSDLPLSLAIGGTIAALCAACAFGVGERAHAEGRTTYGLQSATDAIRSLDRVADVLLDRLDIVGKVA